MPLALITGATAGIGKATALLLAKNKYELILVGRRTERLKELQKQIKTKTHIFTLDLQKRVNIEKFLVENKTLVKKIDVLVNNAGLARGNEFLHEANPDDWDEMIDTNIKALLHLTRGVLPAMIKNQSGHIVNLGSVAGRWVYPNGAVYCATKHAVRAISEGLRMDLMGHPIRVTNIEPGMVESEFSEVRFGSKEKAKSVYQGMQPLTPQDIADTILWSLTRPLHVNIQELVIYPTDQAAIRQVHRRGS